MRLLRRVLRVFATKTLCRPGALYSPYLEGLKALCTRITNTGGMKNFESAVNGIRQLLCLCEGEAQNFAAVVKYASLG